MNKFLLIGLAAGVCGLLAAAQPTLEVVEFGQKTPAVRETLSSERMELAGNNWTCEIRKSGGPVSGWSLRFTGPRHEPVRLAIRFTSPLDFKPERFWDGHKEREAAKLPLERANFLNAFPLAVAEDGQKGRAVGFAPQTVLSGFRRALTSGGLVLETRIVVDDRRIQTIDIVDYDFLPEFGWRNAVEDYQKAFPAWFAPQPGVDPRIYGISGYLNGAHMQRPFELHAQRFSGIQWEWTYAPWYESGNWFPPGEGWRGKTNFYWNYYGYHKGKQLTREEYHDALKRQMYYGNKIAAPFYYILVKDIHRNAADAYPDAVQGPSALHSLPTNAGKTKSVFAPGSKIFDYLKRQIRSVVENYEVSGFSFDMANSSFLFTTPSQLEYAVGRSWKDDGTVFTSDTVVPIPFSDYIHTLSRDGKTMGTMFNAAGGNISPFTFFHCDGAIIEGPPYADVNLNLPLRLIMGRKPATFWHWQTHPIKMSRIAGDPEKKAAVDLAFKQFYLLKCYELGFNFMNWVSRDAYFRPHLPVIHALSKAGYHPVSAVKGAEPFWVGRFGDDAGTILTLSNPKRETLSRKVRIIHRYLGDGKYAFLPGNGTLEQKIVQGETVFDITLEPKEILVLRAVKIAGDISSVTTRASAGRIELQGDGGFRFFLAAEDFDGNRIPGADGHIFSGKADRSIAWTLLPKCRIAADAAAMTELMSPCHTPAVEAGKGRDTQIAAEMVAMYRPHVEACMKLRKRVNTGAPGFLDASLAKPDLVVTAPGKGKPGKKICLGTPADFPGFTPPADWQGPFLVMPDAETLWIGGSTPEQVRQAALVYFDMLDRDRNAQIRVNFVRPSGWGGRPKFVNGDRQKYLQLIGDPEQKNNQFYYAFYHMPPVRGGDEIAFRVSCKLEKLTAGKFQVGIYEFSDPQATKTIRFQSVDVPVSADWQTLSKTVTLHPKTQCIRFYFLGRGAGKGDTLLVRSLELNNRTESKRKGEK